MGDMGDSEPTYADYTASEIREFLDACDDMGEGLDSLLGDGEIAVNIIRDLLAALAG
jgi:hypothetical protein